MAPFHISATRRDIHNIRAAHSCSLPIRGEWLITHVDPLWWENKTYYWKMPLFDAMILSVWKMTRLFVEFCFAKFQSYFFVTCIWEFGQSLLVLLNFCLFNFYYLEKVGSSCLNDLVTVFLFFMRVRDFNAPYVSSPESFLFQISGSRSLSTLIRYWAPYVISWNPKLVSRSFITSNFPSDRNAIA